jgi:hypothetical protein
MFVRKSDVGIWKSWASVGRTASGSTHETFTNKFPQGRERKNWSNTTGTELISVDQYKIDPAITITAEEQKCVNEFVIAADEEVTGDMSWTNWMLE